MSFINAAIQHAYHNICTKKANSGGAGDKLSAGLKQSSGSSCLCYQFTHTYALIGSFVVASEEREGGMDTSEVSACLPCNVYGLKELFLIFIHNYWSLTADLIVSPMPRNDSGIFDVRKQKHLQNGEVPKTRLNNVGGGCRHTQDAKLQRVCFTKPYGIKKKIKLKTGFIQRTEGSVTPLNFHQFKFFKVRDTSGKRPIQKPHESWNTSRDGAPRRFLSLWAWATCVGSALLGVAAADLPPPERQYNILFLLPMSSTSHRNIFMSVADALAERGHKVRTWGTGERFTPGPGSEFSPTCSPARWAMLTTIGPSSRRKRTSPSSSTGVHDFRPEGLSVVQKTENVRETTQIPLREILAPSRSFFKSPQGEELTKRGKEFDLIIVFSPWVTQVGMVGVEIGGIHCRPGKPLPQELESWISGAGAAGVVYFSLGSTNQGTAIPRHYRDILLQAFRRINQRVLWKNVEEVDDVPENVLVRKWIPQQDVLAHPNVKVFISHTGLLSTQEAAYHATPVLALPIAADQPRNADQIKSTGFGLVIEWEEITVDLVLEALRELIDNPRYRRGAAEVSRAMRDQLMSPKDRAVFWTEYVIRHRGAPKLRCPAADLSWVEFLMLDVLAALLLGVCASFVLLKRLARSVWRAVGRRSKDMEE
ncbi:uncharacterized protein LOC119576750 [Penaeus monodon]|uniref:uncharacterized protein LOC119576750 n=1 Tax=Penaeus monodon TaxID=6687 RepID=UPI0018A7C0AE|nr:uncharacterized protein LOC119576750 [Penaeus monodon]